MDAENGDVRDCACGGVWGTSGIPSLSTSSCKAIGGVGMSFGNRGGEGGGV